MSETRKLHIGGEIQHPDWEILNIVNAPDVDHVANADKLEQFADNTFSEIYASHILEHFDFRGQILEVVNEWFRVLQPGGKLSISVPDLEILAEMYLDKENYNFDERFNIMQMMYGEHLNPHDYHYIGFNEETLTHLLALASFEKMQRVESFNLFDDTSHYKIKDRAISLNLTAIKPLSK